MRASWGERRLLRREIIGPVGFLALSAFAVVVVGVPDQRDVIAVWVVVGLLAFSLSDLRGWASGVMRDWLPFFGLLIAYDTLRGSAKGLFAAHYLPQLQVDHALFGSNPTASLQHAMWRGHPRWYDLAAAGVYLTHFFATPLLAAVLWKIDRTRFRRFVALVATMSAAGLLTYLLYPAAPPWMASQDGFLPHLTRIIPNVWHSLDLHFAGTVVEGGYRYANDVAAVPSLHAAFALLVAVFLWPRRRKWLRPIVALYPVAMGFSLVYTGEHYVSDILLGWVYAVGAVFLVRALMRWRGGAKVTDTARVGETVPLVGETVR
jgi:membrane-associated phospholipid phosphatase